MHRCLELARLGAGHVAPNPMVGAVLVYNDRIIGEGYHQLYGKTHAEVNCLDSVSEANRQYIDQSTIYVSLEPCAHHGKTPPCADLLIANRVPRVVVGCRDPFPLVNGKGIEKLKAAGIDVQPGILETECRQLNSRFFTFHTRYRPYVLLKWAQSANGLIARAGERTAISNEYTNRLVHKWRSEEAAILVGPRTALIDNPALTARLWTGPDPIRLVIDKNLELPADLQLFDRKTKTIVFNSIKHEEEHENLHYYQIATDSSIVNQLLLALHQLKIQSVLVEGGARLLQSFIDEDAWDEARIITNNDLHLPAGLPAPRLTHAHLRSHESLLSDTIRYYHHD
ncbi:bifunctional diaminohydroxyphosphoribosylaminopyrimidine deaminase/5-amino-6-(5-phosphoribosylamino)uracil reductase RibD [Puia sp.]|jgi:diaminohydroxyphosphoribosylaminopyrimidine deaminase/5-amino-6-(5-phosphoribosylamino)uracil reductase|uniref:bifunctional diaminohydroxyphosphoribosylaminopyrimidine deaminase/5-amino-6-(5-phosphoribosylamino)uracil reductase RibD n=1 Tax=Puia sp. TaxID=2045100 RepID=UPI002F42E7EB